MQIGLRLGIGRGQQGFDPASLFAGGVQGVWFDPSDLSTMFQDSAGATPVTASGQPVGRMLDKSGRGNHATMATAAKRPIYTTGSGLAWLAFDGVDDAMQTSATLDFTATDAMSFFAGVRKTSDAAFGALVELGILGASGTMGLTAPQGAAANYRFAHQGSVFASAVSASTFAAPISNVLTGIGDISDDQTLLRINGIQAAITVTNVGTGNYSNSQLFIGGRSGTSLYFNGLLYGLVVLGATTSAASITATEQFLAAKSGVVL